MKGRHALHIILLMLWSFFCISPAVPAHFAAAAILETAMGGPAEDAGLPRTPSPSPQEDTAQAPDSTAAQTDLTGNTPPSVTSAEKSASLPADRTQTSDAISGTALPEQAARADAPAPPLTVAENSPRSADSSTAAQDKSHGDAQPDKTDSAQQDNAPDAILPDDDAGKSVADGVEGHAQPHKDTAAAEAATAAPATATAGGSADGTNGKKLKLFGTVEFRGKLNSVPRWLDAMKRNTAAPLFADENVKLSAKQTWKSFKASLLKMKPLDQLKAVNTFWNQWPYRTDPEVYGKPDYWASPREFRSKSGDCEDYCIVKYFTLKELGWHPEQMRIVVVMETIRRIGHAVLAVYLDGKIYILDILSKNVLEHTVFRNYIPQFSVNEQYKWMHMQPNKK